MNSLARSLLLAALFSCAAVTTAAVKYYGFPYSRGAHNHVPYTITWRVTAQDGGEITDTYTETRFVASNGNWRSVKQFPDGRTEEMFAEVGRGVFVVKPAKQKTIFLSGYDAPKRDPEAYGAGNPYHVGADTILGYRAYKIKQNQGGTSVEFSHAPALNGDMIKMLRRDGECSLLVEPVSIVEGEPNSEAMAHGEFPADYKHYEKVHGKPPDVTP